MYYTLPESNQPYASLTNDLLAGMLWGGKCIGYRQLNVTDVAAVGFDNIPDPDAGGPLTAGIPAGAKYAICVLEAGVADVDKARVARFRTDAINPTAAVGMPVGDNGSFEIKGSDNLAAFRIIGINAGVTHVLRIEFYGEG